MERSITLYHYLVANCFKGGCTCTGSVHVCRTYWSKTFDETEGPRLLRIRTFLNTVIAISTSVQGAADLARKDRSLPHKSVRFPNEKPYLLEEQEVDASRTTGGPSTEEPAITVANITNRFTPDIIEMIIVCDCPKHKHCLTCHFAQSQLDRGLEEFFLGPSRFPRTRWLHALNALERATKIWLGEWADSIGWEKQNIHWIAEKLYLPVCHAVHLSNGINDMTDNVRHNVVNAMRKLVKFSGDCARVMALFSRVERSDYLEHFEEFGEEFGKLRKKVMKELAKVVKGLEWLNERIERLVKNLIGPLLNNISLGPKHGRRKLEFMKAVLLRIQADVCGFRKQVEEIEAGWKGEIVEYREWFEKVEPSAGLVKEWHDQIQKGLCDFASRAGRDRVCKCDS